MDAHRRGTGARGCGSGAHRGTGSGSTASAEPLIDGGDLLLENRTDLFRRIHAQNLLEALFGEWELATAHGSGRTEEQSLARVGIESERLLDDAPGTPIELVFIGHGQRFGLTYERLGALAPGKPVSALERAH